jgi:hypothetical protein
VPRAASVGVRTDNVNCGSRVGARGMAACGSTVRGRSTCGLAGTGSATVGRPDVGRAGGRGTEDTGDLGRGVARSARADGGGAAQRSRLVYSPTAPMSALPATHTGVPTHPAAVAAAELP